MTHTILSRHLNILRLFIDPNHEAEKKRRARENGTLAGEKKKNDKNICEHTWFVAVFQYHPDEICLAYVDRVMAYDIDIYIVRKIYRIF